MSELTPLPDYLTIQMKDTVLRIRTRALCFSGRTMIANGWATNLYTALSHENELRWRSIAEGVPMHFAWHVLYAMKHCSHPDEDLFTLRRDAAIGLGVAMSGIEVMQNFSRTHGIEVPHNDIAGLAFGPLISYEFDLHRPFLS